mgnify:CR=1 FL=1
MTKILEDGITQSQRRAMIAFHRKMENAFRRFGKTREAEQAKRKRENLEADTKAEKGER